MLCTQLSSAHTHACTPSYAPLASVPGPVENIKTVVDPKQASVRLSWDPPLNLKTPGEGTTYRIRFKPEGRGNYDEETVTTNCVSLTRNSGLKSSKMHTFEVRAENAEAAGDWKIFSVYIGRFILYNYIVVVFESEHIINITSLRL